MQKLLFVLIGAFFVLPVSSQTYLGLFGGVANYQGDITGKLYQKPRHALGVHLHYPLTSRVALRGGFTLARAVGADSLSESEVLKARNLSFQTNITELSLVGEFHTFDLENKSWSPYVFAGLAIFRFNPYTFDRNGNKIFLQPLSTEGQGLPGYPNQPYARTQLAIPFGGGIKFNLTGNIRLGLEVGLRKLFTDYFDDLSGNYADPADLLAEKGPLSFDLSYRGDELPGGDANYPAKGSQRGSPKYKDYYYFSGIHLSFLLPEGRNGSRAAKKSGYGCPTVF